MTKKINIQRWLSSLITVLTLAGFTSLCQAQTVITLSNDASESSAFYDGGPAGATYIWLSTNGPNGGGCIQGVIDGVTTHEFDPAFHVTFNSGQYYQVTVQLKVDSSSGTQGAGGSGGYGQKQLAFLDASNTWNGVGYATIYPPAANDWVSYTFAVPGPAFTVTHLQFQLQGGGAYSGPVTIYIGDITIKPVPNPNVLQYFTNDVVSANWNNYGLAASWDGAVDAPYSNPVNNSAPVSITPAGSIAFQSSAPGSYQGGQLNLGFNPSQYQSLSFDVYYDGPSDNTTTNFGGMQLLIADANPPYHWLGSGGAISFTANMIGKWVHLNMPCAASGVNSAAGLAVQTIPGSGLGTTPITFHIDNIQTWNPVTLPSITGLTRASLGGVQITLDADGSDNINDQEGITTPTTNNANTDFFWINQTPATYSFTLTNFPSPTSAPQLDSHIYLCNGDSITAFANDYSYNQTYSGAPYNMVDYLGLLVQNGTNGGVVAIVNWKTNAPNSNATNNIIFNFPSMASANGTWTLNFSDNTHGSVIAADGSVNSFTLPDFINDPNYTASFTPVSSMIQFGIFKNGNITNNSQTLTLTAVAVTNNAVTNFDNFAGPGLTAKNGWQVAEYYLDAAPRAIWQPFGATYLIHWNTTAGGWNVQSTSNLLGSWSNAGVTYTYADSTGTNTLGAIQTTNLPAGNAGFFRLVK
jgi:hypothetical protein